jgi:hypothetical protein
MAARKASQNDLVNLVVMVKGEESLEVHPTCVEAHKAAGWSLASAQSISKPSAAVAPTAEDADDADDE